MVEFDKRVFAVALTDSPMKAYTKHCDRNVIKMLQKVLVLKNQLNRRIFLFREQLIGLLIQIRQIQI